MLSSQVQEERRFLTKKSDKIYQCVDVLIYQCDNGAKIKIISQLANVIIDFFLLKKFQSLRLWKYSFVQVKENIAEFLQVNF